VPSTASVVIAIVKVRSRIQSELLKGTFHAMTDKEALTMISATAKSVCMVSAWRISKKMVNCVMTAVTASMIVDSKAQTLRLQSAATIEFIKILMGTVTISAQFPRVQLAKIDKEALTMISATARSVCMVSAWRISKMMVKCVMTTMTVSLMVTTKAVDATAQTLRLQSAATTEFVNILMGTVTISVQFLLVLLVKTAIASPSTDSATAKSV